MPFFSKKKKYTYSVVELTPQTDKELKFICESKQLHDKFAQEDALENINFLKAYRELISNPSPKNWKALFAYIELSNTGITRDDNAGHEKANLSDRFRKVFVKVNQEIGAGKKSIEDAAQEVLEGVKEIISTVDRSMPGGLRAYYGEQNRPNMKK